MNLLNYIRTKGSKIGWFKRLFTPISQCFRKYTLRKKHNYFVKESDSIFKLIYDTIPNDISFWPEYGTLLGIYRDKDFIKHDFDFDFGAFVEDADRIKSLLIANGFKLKEEYIGINNDNIREMTFFYNNVGIDFFFFTTMKDKPTCFVFHPHKVDLLGNDNVYKIKPFYFPKFSLQKIKFKDIEIQVPDNTAAHLEYSYGPNFMVPDPNFKSIHTEFLIDQFARVKKYNRQLEYERFRQNR